MRSIDDGNRLATSLLGPELPSLGWPVRQVLTDNGPEYIARRFQDHLAEVGVAHVRFSPRSPNHNAVCEQFQGTMLQECWRPAFHRRDFNTIRQLQTEANTWLTRYNTRRCNHGDFMRGRTPGSVFQNKHGQWMASSNCPLDRTANANVVLVEPEQGPRRRPSSSECGKSCVGRHGCRRQPNDG